MHVTSCYVVPAKSGNPILSPQGTTLGPRLREDDELLNRLQRLAQRIDHLVDVLLLGDVRRREHDRIARHAREHALVPETIEEQFVPALARRARTRRYFDAADHPDVADADHV